MDLLVDGLGLFRVGLRWLEGQGLGLSLHQRHADRLGLKEAHRLDASIFAITEAFCALFPPISAIASKAASKLMRMAMRLVLLKAPCAA